MKYRIFAVIILGLSILFLADSNAQDVGVAGDTNADGIVNILDLTLVVSHFGKNIDPTQVPNPDVNSDGIVNILDLVFVVNMISGGESVVTSIDNTLVFWTRW